MSQEGPDKESTKQQGSLWVVMVSPTPSALSSSRVHHTVPVWIPWALPADTLTGTVEIPCSVIKQGSPYGACADTMGIASRYPHRHCGDSLLLAAFLERRAETELDSEESGFQVLLLTSCPWPVYSRTELTAVRGHRLPALRFPWGLASSTSSKASAFPQDWDKDVASLSKQGRESQKHSDIKS